MARTLFYIVDFIRFNHFPHLISLFNIFSKNMVGRDPLELLLTDKLCVKKICWDCTFHSLVVQFSTIYSTAALMQLQVGPVHTSAQPWGSFSFQFCQEPLPCWQPARLGFSFFFLSSSLRRCGDSWSICYCTLSPPPSSSLWWSTLARRWGAN